MMGSNNNTQLAIEDLSIQHIGPLSFHVAAGECVSMSGASGTGKTLLLRAIADLYVHTGTMRLHGEDSRAMPAPLWRQRVGYLATESAWWFDTVGEHFDNDKAVDYGAVGFPPEVAQWSIRRLSSGERQRLALLRLLQQQPEVLLLDEPTASLDPGTMQLVEQLIGRNRQQYNAAVIWVGHDAAQRQRVGQRHLVLADGKLVEQRQ